MEEFFCSACVAAMPTAKFYLGLMATIVLCIFSLNSARKTFFKSRLIEDMPTSRIRSASQGYVELIGLATTTGNALTAPLSAKPCLWWRYKIEHYQQSGKSSSWTTIDKGTSTQPLFMKDGSGLCRIEPQGAEVSCLHRKVWHGHRSHPITATVSATTGFLAKLNQLSRSGRYRYSEYLIRENDPLYLLGHFVSDSTGKRMLTIDQVAGQLIRTWTKDYQQLLVRFDSDGNGTLDEQEWQTVRSTAQKKAIEAQQTEPGTETPHSLVQPEGKDLPFLIGSHGQEHLSRKYRWQALGFSALFLAAGAGSSWLITSRVIL